LGCGARACPEKRWGLENAGAARHCDGGVSAGRLRVFRQAVVDGGGEGAGRGFPVGGDAGLGGGPPKPAGARLAVFRWAGARSGRGGVGRGGGGAAGEGGGGRRQRDVWVGRRGVGPAAGAWVLSWHTPRGVGMLLIRTDV
jgi:hypothetical protein